MLTVAVAAGAGGIPSAATDDDGNQTCCAPDPPIWAAVYSLAWSRTPRLNGKSASRASARSTAAFACSWVVGK
jgi:hypothetical protein